MNNFDLIKFCLENSVKVSIKPCNVDVSDPDTIGLELKLSNLNKTVSIKKVVKYTMTENEDNDIKIRDTVEAALNHMLEEIRKVTDKVTITEPKIEE